MSSLLSFEPRKNKDILFCRIFLSLGDKKQVCCKIFLARSNKYLGASGIKKVQIRGGFDKKECQSLTYRVLVSTYGLMLAIGGVGWNHIGSHEWASAVVSMHGMSHRLQAVEPEKPPAGSGAQRAVISVTV